jgi:hypothetical protein
VTAARLALLALLAMMLAAPGRAQTPPVMPAEQPAVAAPIDKKCVSAKRKVDREQKALAATNDGLARDQRAREACTPRSVCSRYDAAIADGERRVGRREARLARFRDEAREACMPR